MGMTRRIMKMARPRYSTTKGIALLAIGAAVGAGIAMMRNPKTIMEEQSEPHWVEDGGGPVETDL